MKNYIYFVSFFLLLVNLSCGSGSDPFYEGIKVSTTPSNAGVFINNKYYGNTPQNIEKSSGSYNISIRRTGYIEFNRTISIPKNDYLDLKTITLVKNDSIQLCGPLAAGLRINGDTTSLCAISISRGMAVKIDDPSADFYLSYNKANNSIEIISLSSYKKGSRNSCFYKSDQTNWCAGYKSSKYDGSWSNQLTDIKDFCFYVYDSDKHYSLFQISAESEPGSGSIVIKWAYNKKVNDINF